MVKEVSNVAEFDSELNAAGSKLVVVDFHALWCGPCKVVAPTFQSLSTKYPNVVFLKVDVDKVQQVAQRYSVRAMPTFLFLKNKSVVETLQGANPSRLTALVAQHSSSSTASAFSGSGNTLSGSSKPQSSRAQAVAGIADGHSSLLSIVEPKESSAINEQTQHRLLDILKGPSEGKWLESDADEQLLIHLSFKQRVKVSGILLRGTGDESSSAPKQVKLFVNRIGLTFDDAVEETGEQTIELEPEHVSPPGKAFALRFVKFQSVDSLTIAVLSNQTNQDSTRIDALDIFGLSGESTNIGDLQKIAAEAEAQDLHYRRTFMTGLKGGSGTTRSNSIPNLASYTEKPTTRHSRSHSSPTIESQPPKLRRQTSAASAPAIVEEEDEDEDAGSRPNHHTIPLSPPYLNRDDDMAFEISQHADAEGFGGWHYAPLVVAMAPPLGALLGGHSDAWSDAILLVLASFWLYQFLRVPWEIYHASRTRRVLSHDEPGLEQKDHDGGMQSDPNREPAASDNDFATISKQQARGAAAAELRRSELMSLIFCVVSPILGAYMLHWMRETMVDGGRYLNAFNIRLFTLAAGIKPWSHAIKLIRRRMLHLQEEVHYPSSRVEALNQRLRRMEADLTALRKMYATKNDLRVLRDSEAQLGRAVRRSERKEEHLRLTAEEKFQMVENRLEDLLREVAINAELIEDERRERELSASLRMSLLGAARYLFGSGRSAAPKQYLQDVNRAVSNSAAIGIGMSSSDQSFTGPYRQLAGHSLSSANGKGAFSVHSSPFAPTNSSSGQATGSGAIPTSASTPSLDTYMINNFYNGQKGGPLLATAPHRQHHQVSYPWWERGVAFYLFLPLNASSAAIRFAGEKAKGMLETPETETTVGKHNRQLRYQQQLAELEVQAQQQSPAQNVVTRLGKGSAVAAPSSKRVASPSSSGRAR